MTRKTKKHYLAMLLITMTLLSPEIEARNNSSNKANSISQSCSALSHQIENDIHALRQNVLNHGTTQATYDAIDRLRENIKNTCTNKKCCKHSLEWKLNNVKKLADKQTKKMKKNGEIKLQGSGGSGLFLAPVMTIAAPAAIISAGGQAG